MTLVEPGFLPRCSRETKGAFFLFLPLPLPSLAWYLCPVHLSCLITIIKTKSRLGVCRYFSRTSCVSHTKGRAPVTVKHSLLWDRSSAKPELRESFGLYIPGLHMLQPLKVNPNTLAGDSAHPAVPPTSSPAHRTLCSFLFVCCCKVHGRTSTDFKFSHCFLQEDTSP